MRHSATSGSYLTSCRLKDFEKREKKKPPASCLASINTLLAAAVSLWLSAVVCLVVFFYSQVQGEFDIQEFNKMCWTLCYKKNIYSKHLAISDDDAFKVWSIFNFLSEDQYPLVIVAEEVRDPLRTSAEGEIFFFSDLLFV